MTRGCACSRVVVGAAVAAAAILASGCTSSPERIAPSPSTTAEPSPRAKETTPVPTPDAQLVAAEAAILEAYAGYWNAKVVSFADPSKEQDPNLQHFAIDTALAEAQTAIFSFRSNGIAVIGQPGLAPVVSDVELGEAPSAKIFDCVDVSNWQPVHAATGASAAPPDQQLRVPTESTASFFDGRRTIRTSVVFREQSC